MIAREPCRDLIMASNPDLVYTCQKPMNGRINVLDLCLFVSNRLYWRYGDDSGKPLFSARSCHPGSVNVVTSFFNAAQKRCCLHFVSAATSLQLSQMKEASYLDRFACLVWKGA